MIALLTVQIGGGLQASTRPPRYLFDLNRKSNSACSQKNAPVCQERALTSLGRRRSRSLRVDSLRRASSTGPGETRDLVQSNKASFFTPSYPGVCPFAPNEITFSGFAPSHSPISSTLGIVADIPIILRRDSSPFSLAACEDTCFIRVTTASRVDPRDLSLTRWISSISKS